MTKKSIFKYDSPKESTGLLLWKTHNYWQREIRKCLKPFDLTHTQFVILANTQWLLLQGEEVKQISIAKQAEVDIMMTSNIIRTLEKKGYLTRKAHQTNTRAKLVSVTPKGFEILKKALHEVENFDEKFFGRISNTASFNNALLELLNKHTSR